MAEFAELKQRPTILMIISFNARERYKQNVTHWKSASQLIKINIKVLGMKQKLFSLGYIGFQFGLSSIVNLRNFEVMDLEIILKPTINAISRFCTKHHKNYSCAVKI